MKRVKTILAFIVLVILWLLTGCTTRIETVEVKVPVRIPCIDEIPPPPELAINKLDKGKSIGAKVQALVIDNKTLEGDNVKLRALMEGCVTSLSQD